MKQADGQGPDHTLCRHLAWSGFPPPAARARAEADALLSVRITVSDTSPAMPRPRPAAPHRVGAHSLEIVAALSSRLIVEHAGEGKQCRGNEPGEGERRR
ncbi:hypothetical protein ACFXAS_13695 [Streptomyces sp. NPDC059459]|uniref:hypothetical protein n=1 Tax=Streptomyces sp. NPDC059459 TaxID=3346839 RepID=UPI0036A5EA7B